MFADQGGRDGRDTGVASLLGLLSVLVVLGAVAGAVLLSLEAEPTTGGASHSSAATAAVGADESVAAQVTCRADYDAVSEAAGTFQVLHGHPPADVTSVLPLIGQPVASHYFTITIGPGGFVDVATPGHPPQAGDGNCAYAGGWRLLRRAAAQRR